MTSPPIALLENILFDTVYDPTAEGMLFVDHKTGRVKLGTKAGAQSMGTGQGNQRLYCQVNDRYLGTIFKNSASNPFGSFTVSMSKMASEMVDIGNNARMNENPSIISGEEYSVNLQPLEEIAMIPLEEQTMWSNAVFNRLRYR